jgi:cyclopropane-fatty-acyl-phospholipid synthase
MRATILWGRHVRTRLDRALQRAGITIDGDAPWDPQVKDPRVFRRVLLQGTLGAGEAYMEGWWECDALDELAARLLSCRLQGRLGLDWPSRVQWLTAHLRNQQSRARAYRVGEVHYDVGNELYRAMLGRTMAYSCADWRCAADLDSAQEAKFDLVCRALALQPGRRLLDVGCGWGGLAKFAAQRFGVEVVGLTISREQARFARRLCAGLPVKIRLQDYRSLAEPFDAVVSIGMVEHVGARNYATYFDAVRRCLADEGRFVLQGIGSSRSTCSTDPWIARYIFPNSMLPSARQLTAAAEGRLELESWNNLASYYDRTLMAWWRNFESAWPTLRRRYDDRFYRKWRYYLLVCAGGFRVRYNQLWRIVYAKHGSRAVARRSGTEPQTQTATRWSQHDAPLPHAAAS